MDKFNGMNQFLKEKLRAPTMTAHDAPDGGDTQLNDAAAMLADEAGDFPYTPPIPVPIMRPMQRGDGQRGSASEVWLVNPPATMPGLGVLVAGGNAEKGSQFPINSIRVDNLTSQWMYWPEIGAFVPPFWYGRVFRFTGALIQRVKFETPTGLTALAAATTEVARVMFSEEYWDEQSGTSMIGNAAPGGGAGNTAVTIYDDLSGLPAEVQTSADAMAQQAGLVVNSFLYGRNAVGTEDELRTAIASNANQGTVGILGAAALAVTNSGVNFGALQLVSPIDALAAGSFNLVGSVGLAMGFNGTWDRSRIPNIFKQINNVALGAGSTATVWTPAAGKKPRLMGWVVDGTSGLLAAAAITFFETSTTGTFMGDVGYIAGGGSPAYASYGPGGPIVSTSSAVIVAFSSTAVTIRGTLFGTEE